ncbi:MAG: hypothetical protein RLZZ422_1400 [Pseudomonadota bacterium]|jgi:CRISPR-associated Csx2 family protein
MHRLVTLLGKVKDPKFSNYQPATYDFGNGNKYSSSFFGLTLLKEVKPDHFIVLGTAGSMWDNLMQEAGLSIEETQQLHDLSQAEAVTEDYLKNFVSILESYIGTRCSLKIIPYGRNTQEQTQILHTLMGDFEDNDKASLDVTHGFRHLPMLVQQSALLLQTLKSVKINGIFYGAWDMRDKNGIAPVMHLDGLLEVECWTKALYRYEQNGDYTAFQEPLEHEELPNAALHALQKAAHYERTFNLVEAGKQLDVVKSHLPKKFNGIGGFFTESFNQHITWSDNKNLQKRQSKLAHFYLRNNEFVRACIFGLESFITSLLEPNELNEQQNFLIRKDAVDEFKKFKHSRGTGRKHLKNAFMQLSRIRNALAHGTEPNANVALIMQDSMKLKNELEGLFNKLDIKP